jgi:hypothetical protein
VDDDADLTGRRVLVVEDEFLLALVGRALLDVPLAVLLLEVLGRLVGAFLIR